MKEAVGEANMTVITIVLIALALAAGYFILNKVMNNSHDKIDCENNGGVWTSEGCNMEA